MTRGVGGSLMCGGSLVAADTVLTAGHCCDGMSAGRLGVEVHCTVLHYTALHCPVLHCTALHCTTLHCTALH